MAKIFLVTGSSGYIGGQTMLKLKDKGNTVIGVDVKPPPEHLKSLPDRFYQEDFSSPYALSLLESFTPTAIIHCAGSSLVGPSVTNPERYFRNNFAKTKIMLDHIVKNRIRTRMIFSSSAAVYGDPAVVPCTEDHATMPVSPYGESKLMVEMMLRSYAAAYDLDWIAFRYFNACGADPAGRHGQEPKATHIIARVLESIRDDQTFTLFGDSYPTADGTCVRDYVHVEDIADAHVMAIDTTIPGGVYNLGTSHGASNREIIALAESVTARAAKVRVDAARSGDPAVLTASAALFSNTAGWHPRYTLEQMVQHAWQWYTRDPAA